MCRGAHDWPVLGSRWELGRVWAEGGHELAFLLPGSLGRVEYGARAEAGDQRGSWLLHQSRQEESAGPEKATRGMGLAPVWGRAGISGEVQLPTQGSPFSGGFLSVSFLHTPPLPLLPVGSCGSWEQGREQLDVRAGRRVGDPGRPPQGLCQPVWYFSSLSAAFPTIKPECLVPMA